MSGKAEPLFPVALAAKLCQSVNFDNLTEWAEHAIARRRVELEGDLKKTKTAHVRGQIAALKTLRTLRDKCEEILHEG